MGTGEESAASKPKPATSTQVVSPAFSGLVSAFSSYLQNLPFSMQEIPATPSYPDWSSSMQVYDDTEYAEFQL